MRKTIALIAGILSVASAFAVRPNLGAPITGSVENGSYVDVRVTANVVEGVAVNEASPIDFGNLVKDNNAAADTGKHIYEIGEKISEHTPGRVVYRANTNNGYSSFTTRLERDRIDLSFYGSSGVEDTVSTNGVLKNIKIEGIGTKDEEVSLVGGKAERTLTAWFQAYDNRKAEEVSGNSVNGYSPNYQNGNLGQQQKLGYYEGTVKVIAVAKGKIGSN